MNNTILQRARLAASSAVRRHRIASKKSPRALSAGFAVGGCAGNCNSNTPMPTHAPLSTHCAPQFSMGHNECYHAIARKLGCPMRVVSGGVRNIASGAVFNFEVVPTQSNHFLPVAMLIQPEINVGVVATEVLRAMITAVTVKSIPQETYHDPAPTLDVVQGISVSTYARKNGAGDKYGVPGWEVAWSPFSRDSHAERLQITGINRGADPIDVRAEIWGYELDSLPQGWRCGYHPCREPENRQPIPVG